MPFDAVTSLRLMMCSPWSSFEASNGLCLPYALTRGVHSGPCGILALHKAWNEFDYMLLINEVHLALNYMSISYVLIAILER